MRDLFLRLSGKRERLAFLERTSAEQSQLLGEVLILMRDWYGLSVKERIQEQMVVNPWSKEAGHDGR